MKTAIAALTVAFAGEAIATEWNVSVWGKRQALPSMLRNWQIGLGETNGDSR